MRTTISIDQPVFQKIRAISHKERKPLTKVISDLLVRGLHEKKSPPKPARMHWQSRNLGARIDYRDKETLYKTMEK